MIKSHLEPYREWIKFQLNPPLVIVGISRGLGKCLIKAENDRMVTGWMKGPNRRLRSKCVLSRLLGILKRKREGN